MVKKHILEAFRWFGGKLDVRKQEFESLDDAKRYADQADHDHAKIFDGDGNLVHISSPATTDYA